MSLLRQQAYLVLLLFLTVGSVSAQLPVIPGNQLIFTASPNQLFGLDVTPIEDTLKIAGKPYFVFTKAMGENKEDKVCFRYSNKSKKPLKFFQNGKQIALFYTNLSDSLFELHLRKERSSYELSVVQGSKEIGRLSVKVYPELNLDVHLIPVVSPEWDVMKFQEYMDSVYGLFNVRCTVTLDKPFFFPAARKEKLFENPSPQHERYTRQMLELRDAYFRAHPTASKNAYYVFVIDGFIHTEIGAYMVQKGMFGFVSKDSTKVSSGWILNELSRGIGALGNMNYNLVSNWDKFHRNAPQLNYYDNYEDVQTSGGIVAYYFWEENKDGTIKLEESNFLSSIRRPFKKNYCSWLLEITDRFYEVIYRYKKYRFNTWDILVFIGISVVFFFIRRKLSRYIRLTFRRSLFLRLFLRITAFILSVLICILLYFLIDRGYERFVIGDNIIKEFKAQSMPEVIKQISMNENETTVAESAMQSEILFKKGSNWIKRKAAKVLYFSGKVDSRNNILTMRYVKSSDTLTMLSKQHTKPALSHYMVLRLFSNEGQLIEEKLYNHLGVELTDKIGIKDPAKRILLFVNGYRSASYGGSIEESIEDIRKNGLELPSSKNLIYSFDRFDYWNPWSKMDELFRKRINPSDTYYADGNFSVATSNHRSLLKFTSLMMAYPKRCKNPKKHMCYTSITKSSRFFGSKRVPTVELLATASNRSGFDYRRENGRIAGRNVYQLLNELPNRSQNDTLFIVAHSMGYAYALGIADVLRGHVNFGGLYVIAAENAQAGKINLSEWLEVWQYGTKLNGKDYDPPCLQDGIAAQSKLEGLPDSHRIYFPNSLYENKGFSDSHFIGYYKWIFTIPEGKPGAVRQR